jgi:hypothetical protein
MDIGDDLPRLDQAELGHVIDEIAHRSHVLQHRGEVSIDAGHVVADRLERRLERRDRRSQIVARPRDQLAASIEQFLEPGGRSNGSTERYAGSS